VTLVGAPDRPLLSLVIPVHGVEAYLAECLDSVLAGDFGTLLEIVAIDDRSTDSSGEILDRYAARDPRLRVFHLAANVGLGRARNAGLEHATGEYVWFVDADDWLPPGAVRAVLDRLARTRPDVLLIDHVEVFPDGRRVPGAHREALRDFAAPMPLACRPELMRMAHSACVKVVRRAFLDEIGLRFTPGWYEDISYSHRLLLTAPAIDGIDRVCYCYRQRSGPGSITKTTSRRHFEVFEQYRRLFAVLDHNAPAYDLHRAQLFAVMVDHCLVIAGNEARVPPRLRRAFFRQLVRHYRRYRPAGGYPRPGGVPGLKHRLVHHGSYAAYAGLRAVYRELGLGDRTPAPAGTVLLPTLDMIESRMR
jgi:CDP-glycerol glycerophosphotransferase